MAIANASMLDEATAAAEAMTLALRVGKSASRTLLRRRRRASRRRSTSCARAPSRSASRSSSGPASDAAAADAFAVLLQYPGAERRRARLPRARRRSCTRAARCVIVAADLLALTLLTPPGEWGADVAVGHRRSASACRWATAARTRRYLATRDEFKRSLPGRLVGVTVDAHGEPAYRLALQTREQHIRREKATSNICTAQVLLAVMARMYAVYHGPDGLTRIARRVHRLTAILRAGLERLGFDGADAPRTSTRSRWRPATRTARDRRARASREGINFRRVDDGDARHLARRDDDARRRRARCGGSSRRRRRRSRSATSTREVDDGHAADARAHVAVPHAPGLQPLPLRDRDAALPAPPRRPRPGARPLDDPARLVHDEAQRDDRDDPGDVARVRRAASVRAGRTRPRAIAR